MRVSTLCQFLIFFLALPALASDSWLVSRVIDGDTIVLANGERVRYIGIDTAETEESLGDVMKEYNRRLVEGKNVRLEFDRDRHDRYGRLLAYVYVDDLFVNALLVKQGLARVMTVKPNVRYKEYFKQLELEAKKARRGIWSK
ncbi:MAG: thermonuclease family protein [Candidatus Brocadiales bacterium]|nr:thermonuclease family protein [Candidatus Bathyanammoxibius amoris]